LNLKEIDFILFVNNEFVIERGGILHNLLRLMKSIPLQKYGIHLFEIPTLFYDPG